MKLPKLSVVVSAAWKTAEKFLLLILKGLGAILALSIPIGLVRLAMDKHWSLGFPVVLMLGLIVHRGVRAYKEGGMDTWQGIVTLGSILSIIVSAFTFLTFVLNKFGRADYTGFNSKSVSDPDYVSGSFFEMYVFELFEVIPGVKVNEAFGQKASLTRSGFGAGLLVLTFRVLIVFIVLDVFRKWWVARNKRELPPRYQNRRAMRHYRQHGRRA